MNKNSYQLQHKIELPQYFLSTDIKTVELVGSPTISIPKKGHFSFLRGGKPDNTVFTMTPENIFDTAHPVREDQDEDSTSGYENNN